MSRQGMATSLESLEEVNDKEDLTTNFHGAFRQENSGDEPHLIEDDRGVVDMKEIPTSHMDKKEENTIVGSVISQLDISLCFGNFSEFKDGLSLIYFFK
jgi:hypothetical protein